MEPWVLNLISLFSLAILLMFGAFLSASEMAFSSLSRARINSLAESGGKRGKRAQLVAKLYESHFDEVLSTVLICNNFVAITSATVSAALFMRLIPEYGYVISTIVISVIVILFTDILPKSTTKENPEKIALACAPFTNFLMRLLTPVNKGILKLKSGLGSKINAEDEEAELLQNALEKELIFMVEEAETDGIINEDDSALITNAIEFNEVSVWEIITPRVNILSIPLGASVEETAELFLESGYSRMPVIDGSIDSIKGIVLLRDFLKCMATSGSENPITLEHIITPAVYTVRSAHVSDVLNLLKKEKSHMAIVADEFGGTEGLVTMEDILEQLVGEIWDENDEVVEDFLKMNETKHRILGAAPVDKMFEYFGIQAESEASTVCGWIMDELRRVPEDGDSFTFEKLIVTVTKTDNRLVEECEIEVTSDEDEPAAINEEELSLGGVAPEPPLAF